LKFTGFHAVSLLVDQESHLLFVVTNGKAYAYNPESHREIWKNEMKGMGVLPGQGIVRMGENLIVGTFGKAMCMNKKTGTTLWSESLPSW
jgi:outer membrane protein assembly factor BamB